MKRAGIWFLLSCKRYGKRLSFVLTLLMLPVICLFLRASSAAESQTIRIAVCALGDQSDELGGKLVMKLTDHENASGLFHFYACLDEQQVKDEVASRRAECGFVIYENLADKLDQKKYKRCIGVYSSPATVTDSLATEVVFAALVQLYDRELFQDYVLASDVLGPVMDAANDGGAGIADEAVTLYDKWSTNESTFRFTYAYLDGTSQVTPAGDKDASMVFPVRGMIAVFIFIAGLYGAVMDGMDERRGMFLPLTYRERVCCRLAAMAGPVCLAALSGLAAIWCGHVWQQSGREITVMVVYVVLVVGFSWMMGRLCRNPQVLCCCLPFFVIGSLLLCPVFVDVSVFLPKLGMVGRLFLPYYYLKCF